MKPFIEVIPLALTPLTPIHIGCGEDFEPTNYVIDGGVLYHFEPSRLALTQADRQRLIACANKKADEAIREIQRFFYEKRDACREASRLAIPVASGVAEWYVGRVGKIVHREGRGRTVSNQLEIERTAHHPHTGRPYLPGSSLKGSLRTGWLNGLDKGPPLDPKRGRHEESTSVEAGLLDGTFHADPFRLIDVADAAGKDVQSRIVFAVDRRKQPRLDRNGRIPGGKNLFVRREAIRGGQLRVLQGELRFKRPPEDADPKKVPRSDKRIGDFTVLARACNRFYLQRLEEDLKILRELCADRWLDEFEKLIMSFRPAFDDGRAMLLRVGRHSGAESVTLERHRSIRIRTGRYHQDYWARAATTIWLAAEREDDITGLRPFGWLLIEPADNLPGDALKRWCDMERKAPATPTASDRRGPSSSAPPGGAPSEIWDRARLQYDAREGTLTAIGPDNAKACAYDEQSDELLAQLPEEVRRRMRAGQYVWETVRVRGHELIAIEPKP